MPRLIRVRVGVGVGVGARVGARVRVRVRVRGSWRLCAARVCAPLVSSSYSIGACCWRGKSSGFQTETNSSPSRSPPEVSC